ncbi:hypothetical protein GPICK_13250 [Geobacter pickeringii]|uniref:Uncharacterized protein n=1 Tax=Geobacter pickeringii TaxID=345632 RepID=A0A0B5BJD6_9BACT|nr:hypothetical protein GPICK_13250 [Geobacter pickeringii]
MFTWYERVTGLSHFNGFSIPTVTIRQALSIISYLCSRDSTEGNRTRGLKIFCLNTVIKNLKLEMKDLT